MPTPYLGGYAPTYGPYQSAGTPPPSGPDFTLSVTAQRAATLGLPSGGAAADYEYQFRPGPSVNAQRQADFTTTLASGETAADYEYQVR